MTICRKCGKELDRFDKGFYKKLVNRAAEDYMCIGCTSGYFRFSEKHAWEMIRRFQKQGCMLFPPLEDDNTE